MAGDEVVYVKLVADFLDGKAVYEAVPALKIGDNRFKLLGSPGYAPGVAKGDEIEMAPSERLGYRILKRSGNVCVQVFLYRCEPRDRQNITKMAESIGGCLDGGDDAP